MSGYAVEQQVNLYQPIMGAERRLFSAQAIAVALLLQVVCLAALAGFAASRTKRIERSVEALAKREAANLAMAASANLAARPGKSLADLDADAKVLAADIDARQRAFDILRQNADPATGFAARLESLAQPTLEGFWLTTIVVGPAAGTIALRGGATQPWLVPMYLTALAHQGALRGAHLDHIAMRRALPKEAPADFVFDLDGPDLPLPPREAPR